MWYNRAMAEQDNILNRLFRNSEAIIYPPFASRFQLPDGAELYSQDASAKTTLPDIVVWTQPGDEYGKTMVFSAFVLKDNQFPDNNQSHLIGSEPGCNLFMVLQTNPQDGSLIGVSEDHPIKMEIPTDELKGVIKVEYDVKDSHHAELGPNQISTEDRKKFNIPSSFDPMDTVLWYLKLAINGDKRVFPQLLKS
jgi:hypothetical protein